MLLNNIVKVQEQAKSKEAVAPPTHIVNHFNITIN